MIKYIPTNRAAAKEAATLNDQQTKLIVDTPSIITCLIVLFDNELGSASTRKYVDSCMEGYNKYGRLHENQLPVVKGIILQHSKEIIEIIDSQVNKEDTDIEHNKVNNLAATEGIGSDDDIDEPVPF